MYQKLQPLKVERHVCWDDGVLVMKTFSLQWPVIMVASRTCSMRHLGVAQHGSSQISHKHDYSWFDDGDIPSGSIESLNSNMMHCLSLVNYY